MADCLERARVLVLAVAAGALLASGTARAQAPSLQISAPRNGTIVQPGSTVAITVASPSGTVFSQVMVVGEKPLDLFAGSSTLPFQTSANIPADISLRRYQLHALGRTPGGQEIEASTVVIDVERSDLPASLSAVNGASLSFEGPGGSFLPILVVARFGDGAQFEVTESSRVTYSVADPQVASVSAMGLVTALRAGQTTVTVRYSLGAQTRQIPVAVTVGRR